MQILFIAIPYVSSYIFESTSVTNDENIAMKGQNLKFHFWSKNDKVWGSYLGKKIENRENMFFTRIERFWVEKKFSKNQDA